MHACACAAAPGAADRELLGSPRPGTAPDAGRKRRRGRPHAAAAVPSPLAPGSPEPPTCSRGSAASPSAATAGGCLPLSSLPRCRVRSFPSLRGSEQESPRAVARCPPGRALPTVPAAACACRERPSCPRARRKPGTTSAQRNLVSPAGDGQRGDLPGGSWWAPVGTLPARVSVPAPFYRC